MIPSYFEFFNPVKIISGTRAIDNLPFELETMGAKRPLVVTDKGVVGAGLLKILHQAFSDSEITIKAVFDRTPADSSLSAVKEIAGLYRACNCDSFIAIGGGSAIDTAKGANMAVTLDTDDLAKFAGVQVLNRPMKPFAVIPTTAGTGSEVTMAAMILDTDRNLKMAFTSGYLLPNLAVLDPRMTLTLPPLITAATGMDALAHAMEAYTGLQKNPISDAFSMAAIRLIAAMLPKAVEKADDPDVRIALANASTMAGIAFSNSMVGMVHSLGHATGGVCHVPHGIAMSIFLPHGLEYNLDKEPERIGELLLPMAGESVYFNCPKSMRALKTIQAVRALQQKLRQFCTLPMTLKDAGVPRSKLDLIADKTLDDGALGFNPAAVDREDALKILIKAYE